MPRRPSEPARDSREDVLPRFPTPRGVVRRSLALWGWGHVATGDRRGFAFALLEMACVAAIAWTAPSLLDGSLSTVLFLAGLVFVLAWGGIALAAYRRAVRVRVAAGLPGADGGATELLWLAPLVIAGMLVLWGIGGTLARPEATVARYVGDWRGDDAADAASLFDAQSPSGTTAPTERPPAVARVRDAWAKHDAKIRNDLARLAGSAGPDSGLDPGHPFDSIRFVLSDPPAPGEATVDVQVVRREEVRGTFFGLFPTSSQTLVPVDDLGRITLREVSRPSPRAGVPDDPVWLIVRVTLLGESLGG